MAVIAGFRSFPINLVSDFTNHTSSLKFEEFSASYSSKWQYS